MMAPQPEEIVRFSGFRSKPCVHSICVVRSAGMILVQIGLCLDAIHMLDSAAISRASLDAKVRQLST